MKEVVYTPTFLGRFNRWVVRWVHGRIPRDLNTCSLRATYGQACFKLAMMPVRFLFFDMWKALLEKSGVVFTIALTATILASLAGLFTGLYFVDPMILVAIGLLAAYILGLVVFVMLALLVGACLGEKNRVERMWWTFCDSRLGKVVIWPPKLIFDELLWKKVFRKNEDAVMGVVVIAVILFFVGVVVFFLVYNLINNTLLTILGLGSALGLIMMVVGSFVGYRVVSESGMIEAIKDRICLPIRFSGFKD